MCKLGTLCKKHSDNAHRHCLLDEAPASEGMEWDRLSGTGVSTIEKIVQRLPMRIDKHSTLDVSEV